MPGGGASRSMPASGMTYAADADAHRNPLGILRVDRDRVEPHAAEAGHPVRPRRLIVERFYERPRLAPVVAPEESGRLGPRPHDVRRRGVPGLDVPRPLEL